MRKGERKKKVGREKRKRKRRYLYYSKKSDRENRETGRLRPWQSARTSRRAEGSRTIPGGLLVARMKPAVHEKDDTAYGSRGTRVAVLPRDHFLCKIKYCKCDGSGHTRTHTHACTHPYRRKDRKGKKCLCFYFIFYFEQGESTTKLVLCEAGW